jgi:hypothetical protein
MLLKEVHLLNLSATVRHDCCYSVQNVLLCHLLPNSLKNEVITLAQLSVVFNLCETGLLG